MIKLRLSVTEAAYHLSVPECEYRLSVIQAQPIYTGGDEYKGPYQIEPKFIEETLATKGKLMKENVIVSPIDIARVTNPSGGTTVYIGGKTNG